MNVAYLLLEIEMEVISLGELLAEFMQKGVGETLDQLGDFVGPFPSGAPAIFADSVVKLGHSCGVIGVVGNDDFGKVIIRRLKEDGVDISRIRVLDDYPTGTAFVTYFGDGSRKFVFNLRHAAAGQLSPDDVDPTYLSGTKFLHVMGSALSVSDSSKEACYKALRLVKENGGRVSFDPNLRPELLNIDLIKKICAPVLKDCDVILPNIMEARILTGEKDPRKSARKFLDMGIGIVAIKMGKKGSMIATDEGAIQVPSFSVEEVDPTGAGDSYDAGFVCGLLDGKDIEETAFYANAVGALATTKMGGMEGIPTRDEVIMFLKEKG